MLFLLTLLVIQHVKTVLLQNLAKHTETYFSTTTRSTHTLFRNSNADKFDY